MTYGFRTHRISSCMGNPTSARAKTSEIPGPMCWRLVNGSQSCTCQYPLLPSRLFFPYLLQPSSKFFLVHSSLLQKLSFAFNYLSLAIYLHHHFPIFGSSFIVHSQSVLSSSKPGARYSLQQPCLDSLDLPKVQASAFLWSSQLRRLVIG